MRQQARSTFNGPLTVTGANGLEAVYTNTNTGAQLTCQLNNVLTAAGGKAESADGSFPAQVNVNNASALSGIFNVNANGKLNLVVAQSSFGTGSIAVNSGGVLVGDMGTATWGPGNNIDVKNGAILAIGAGTTPTSADIGVGVAWQGVTGIGTWVAGNDGTSVYQGLALGGFSTNLQDKTLRAQLGSGDVNVQVVAGLADVTTNNTFFVESLDGTGVANFHLNGLLRAKGGSFNSAPATGNQVTTFNLIGEVPSTAQILNLYSGFRINSDQFDLSGVSISQSGGDILVTGLLVPGSGGGGYGTWADTNAGGGLPDEDYDNDGVSNGVEYFMGLTPADPVFTPNPGVDATKTVTWTNGGNIPDTAYGTQFVVQISTDLAHWTDVDAVDPNLSNTPGSVSYTLGGVGKSFVRLKVTPD